MNHWLSRDESWERLLEKERKRDNATKKRKFQKSHQREHSQGNGIGQTSEAGDCHSLVESGESESDSEEKTKVTRSHASS